MRTGGVWNKPQRRISQAEAQESLTVAKQLVDHVEKVRSNPPGQISGNEPPASGIKCFQR